VMSILGAMMLNPPVRGFLPLTYPCAALRTTSHLKASESEQPGHAQGLLELTRDRARRTRRH